MRKISMFLAMMLIATSITACGNESAKVAELEAQIAELQAQLDEKNGIASEDQAAGGENKVVVESENETVEESESDVTFKEINYGETITLDFVTMTIGEASVSEELKPEDTSSVYSYLSDNEDEKYFYLKIDMENTSGSAYSVENMVINFTFDDKYNYTGRVKACDGGNDFYGDYIDPFDTTTAYLVESIPDKLLDSYSKCVIQFGFKDEFSGSYYDDMEECNNFYQLTLTK